MLPAEDLKFAAVNGLTFYASVKHRRGGPWEDVTSPSALEAAYARARSEQAFERAVFIETDSGGAMYWTSRFPTTFNSVVLAQVVQERSRSQE